MKKEKIEQVVREFERLLRFEPLIPRGSGRGLGQLRIRGRESVRQPPMGGKPHCKACGFRVRGKVENHESGIHHQRRANR